MSHTVKVDVQMTNKEALIKAAEICKLNYAEGTHRLFGSTETGMAINLPGWKYPVVVHADGTIAYDNYGGHWGDIQHLENLKGWYSLSCVQMKCHELGWTTSYDEQSQKLTVFHPDGGTITVEKEGQIEAFGFQGASCNTATSQLEQALGKRISEVKKPEYEQLPVDQAQHE